MRVVVVLADRAKLLARAHLAGICWVAVEEDP